MRQVIARQVITGRVIAGRAIIKRIIMRIFAMKIIARHAIALLGFSLAFAMPLMAEPLAGKIWHVSENSFVSFNDMLKNVSNKTYIIIGERHGRKAHQGREAFLIGALAEAGRYPTISFEMLNHQQDAIVKEYRKKSPEYALGLAMDLNWSDSNWPAWSFYQPVFNMAFTTKAEIFGADLTDAEQDEAKRAKTSDLSAPSASLPYYQDQMTAAHCGLIKDDKALELAYLQIARDQQMAATLRKHRDPKYGGLLVAGSAHIRKSTGIPNYLPANKTSIIYLKETDDNMAQFTREGQNIISGRITDFDYIWFTPKIKKISLCDRLNAKSDKHSNSE